MVYLVRTKYMAGIYLSSAAVKANVHFRYAAVSKYDSYEKAKQTLINIAEEYAFPLQESNIRPNKLFQIRDRHIYCVLTSKDSAAFMDEDKIREFLQIYPIDEHSWQFSKLLTYEEAIGKMMQKGAVVPRGKYYYNQFKCGRIYKRVY